MTNTARRWPPGRSASTGDFQSKVDGHQRAKSVWICKQCAWWHAKSVCITKPLTCAADGCESDTFHFFPSTIEAKHYQELRLLVLAGQITSLTVHPTFRISHNGVDVCRYVGDFSYVRDGNTVYEDVKPKHLRTDIYKLKKKLVLAFWGIDIVEVTGR